MKTCSFGFFLVSCCLSAPLFSANIVVTDPTRVSGTNAIAPNNAINANASGTTSQATLEGLSDFAAIQEFAFTGNQSTANSYIFNLTGATLPSFKLTYSGDVAASSVNLNNAAFRTSNDSSMRMGATNSSSAVSVTIQLGKYDANNDTFTNYSLGEGVTALGFSISGARFTALTSAGLTVVYRDALGNALSTQNFANTVTGTNVYGYTGYQSADALIASVSITYAGAGGSLVPLFGLDDLGTTLAVSSIPEPSSFALLAALACAGAVGLRRRRR